MKNPFDFASTPQLYFGAGKIRMLTPAIKLFGSKVLLITGSKSFSLSPHYTNLLNELTANTIFFERFAVIGEPSPIVVDEAVKTYAASNPSVVVAIGGGSVLDAGKAISAMLPLKEPVKNYLEGVGIKPDHPGVKVPFIAVPTTSGTGSEATKNAVLSEVGEAGFKKSIRHNNFVPNVSVVDPALTLSCSPAITAASGMDAFTQLLESYLSIKASPISDALAYEGLKQVSNSLRRCYNDGADISARAGMSLASYLSGITLANAGLGLVHGFASAIGGYFNIPHGEICSALMASVNKVTVRKLRQGTGHAEALTKYAHVGKMFAGTEDKSNDYYVDFLLDTIEKWAVEMNIPRLRHGGVEPADFNKIIGASDNKNNPVSLNREEMFETLEMAV